MSNEHCKKNGIKNFIIILLLICLVVATSIVCVCLDNKMADFKEQQNIVNTLAQIQMAIVALVITMISITTTFLNENIYGVRLKDILKLRRGINLTLLATILILMVFTSFTIVSMIFNLFYCSLLMTLYTIVVCIWISIQDLPLCFKSDKALISLLKNNKKNIDVNGLKNTDTYNKLVINLIADKKIDKAYNLLKTDDDKQLLIDYMFNLIVNKLTNFKHFKDIAQNKIEFDKYSNEILENISLLFNKESKVFSDYGDDDKLSIYLAKIFYYIHEYDDLLDETTLNRFESNIISLFWLLFIDDDVIQKRIVFNVYQQLLLWSFRECDLWFVKLLKKAYSNWSHTFSSHKLANVLFAEISFVLFFYYQYEELIPLDKKEQILEFVKNQDVYSINEIGLSWRQLFQEHINNYSLTFHDLFESVNPESFEFMLVNHCKSCLFSQRSLAEWWLNCFISSTEVYELNYEDLKKLNTNERNALAYYVDGLFEPNTDKMKPISSLKDFNIFFGLDDFDVDFNNNILYEKSVKTLYKFKNDCNKEREQEYIDKSNVDKDLDKLQEYLYNETNKFLKSIGFFDESIDLIDVQPRGFYNLEEIFELENSKSLYLEMIKNCFTRDFYKIFDEQLEDKIIPFNKSINENVLNKCLEIKPIFTTEKIMYVLKPREDISSDIKLKLEELDDKIKVIKNNPLFHPYCYGNDKSVKFRYIIDTFELKPLSDENLIKAIDQYKAENGLYFYHGVQYNYSELIKILRKKLFTMKVYLKYKIIYDENNICVFDPWNFYERRKLRKINKK